MTNAPARSLRVSAFVFGAVIAGPVGWCGRASADSSSSAGASTADESRGYTPHARTVDTGLRYVLEGIEVRGNTSTLTRVVTHYVSFHAGDTIHVDDPELELTRFRLLGTGFFRDVQLSLRRGKERGFAILVVEVAERNTIVINDGWLGLSRDAQPDGAARPLTAYGGADIAETNLAGTGITLGGAFAVADTQLALRTRFADPQFLRSAWMAEAEFVYNHALDFFGNRNVQVWDPSGLQTRDFAVLQYRRFGGEIGAGRDLGISTRLALRYRLESIDAHPPAVASHARGFDVEPIDFQIIPGNSILSAVGAGLVHDTRDEPVLPTRGTSVFVSADASLHPLGSSYSYIKVSGRASRWFPLSWGHVLRLDGEVGFIVGDAPLFEKFYVGDYSDLLPDRVLGLNFDRRPAPNFLRTAIADVRYGRYAAKIDAEYRIPLYRGRRTIYGVDLFGAAGFYSVADDVDFTAPSQRFSGLARIPVDFTFNVGLRIDTSVGGFAFGVSGLLGLIPVRGEAE